MKTLILLILVAFNQMQCSESDGSEPGGESFLSVVLLPAEEQQEIQHFGASDAWSTQFVGKNWPEAKKNKLADLLFSTQNKSDGSPEGIGLSVWRFNIGAGSTQQGSSSGISDEWRRAPGFLQDDGSYDWDSQIGQRWFLKAASQRGVNQFIGFVNSPPVQLTKNGKAYASDGTKANLSETKYSDYANFLSEVVTNIKQLDGIEFDYISPFNEPQWDWTNSGQEGSPWLNSEIAACTRVIDEVFTNKGILSHIDITESGQLNYLYEDGNRPGRGNHINTFFNANSPDYVGGLSSLSENISGHSYYTTYDSDRLLDVRKQVRQKIQSVDPGLSFWMSEYCLLENNDEIVGNGRDLGMDPALYLARLIHTDLSVADASSWQWWLAISPYDYKDGLLYIDYDKNDGEIFESKIFWALGHYSRFIRPGARRINTWRSDNKTIEQSINGLLVSGYRNAMGDYVAVIINQNSTKIPVKVSLKDTPVSDINGYITSGLAQDNMTKMQITDASKPIDIPARSMVTLVLE